MSGFLAQGGGYRNLRVYKLTEIIYDLSVIFAEKFIRKGSRTRDQIEQAARSGKQHPRTVRLREYLKSGQFIAEPMQYARKMNAEEYCNLCITLINQATYMLRRLIERQQEQFLQTGGIREQMHRARLDYRSRTGQTGQTCQTPKTP
ncbi:MAG: four helix bundle suffix domain-containing protein [Muribaculaceae bacterium]|nr:four helix bundle suffix domain-containing protein [Muribaculaceae bacterium]